MQMEEHREAGEAREGAAECDTCRANRGEVRTLGGALYQDGLWRLEHVFEPVPVAGWLVLKPLRHVEAFAELTEEEASVFGPLVRRITQAMTKVLAPSKVYVCLFAEHPRAAHVHVHLIPRAPGLPPEYRGPGIFRLLSEARTAGRSLVDTAEAERVATAIRDRLATPS